MGPMAMGHRGYEVQGMSNRYRGMGPMGNGAQGYGPHGQ